MAIEALDWAIFLSFFGFVVLIVLSERSAFFEVLAGLVAVILAALLDANVFMAQPDLVRYGTFVIWIVTAVALFAHGAMDLPREFGRGA